MSRSNIRSRGAVPVGIFVQDAQDTARSISLLPELYAAVYSSPDRTAQRGDTRLTLAKLNELTQRLSSTIERFASNYSSAVTPARDATFIRRYTETHGEGVDIPARETKVSAANNPAYYTNAAIDFARKTLNQDPSPDFKDSGANYASLQEVMAILESSPAVRQSENKNLYLLSRGIVSSLVRLSIGARGLKHNNATLAELIEAGIVEQGRAEGSVSPLQRSTVIIDEDLKQLIDIAVRQRDIINSVLPPEEKKGRQERKTPQRDLASLEVGGLITWTDLTILYSMLDVTMGILTLDGDVVDSVFVPADGFSADFRAYAEEKKLQLPENPSQLNDDVLPRVVRLANNFRTQEIRKMRAEDGVTSISIRIQNMSRPVRTTARGAAVPAEEGQEE